MTKQQQLALIWRHTHNDYRGKINGERAILILRQGGTHSVPLSALTDAEIADKLPFALHQEEKRQQLLDHKAELAGIKKIAHLI